MHNIRQVGLYELYIEYNVSVYQCVNDQPCQNIKIKNTLPSALCGLNWDCILNVFIWDCMSVILAF